MGTKQGGIYKRINTLSDNQYYMKSLIADKLLGEEETGNRLKMGTHI